MSIHLWQFRKEPWVALEPKTLADVANGTNCIVLDSIGGMVIRQLWNRQSWTVSVDGTRQICQEGVSIETYRFVRYLNPQSSLTVQLKHVPDGRVFTTSEGHRGFRWETRIWAIPNDTPPSIWVYCLPEPTEAVTPDVYVAEIRETT